MNLYLVAHNNKSIVSGNKHRLTALKTVIAEQGKGVGK